MPAAPLIEQVHALQAHHALMRVVTRLDDHSAREPSPLEGWTRGHIVTHLARHADSHTRMLDGLRRGKQVPQYAGGFASRDREIEEGSSRSATDLIGDFETASATLFEIWERLDEGLWDEPVDAIGATVPARALVWSRWCELELHRIDLDLGDRPENWSRSFVSSALPWVVSRLSVPARSGRTTTCSVAPDDLAEEWPLVVDRTRAGTEAHVTIRGPGGLLLGWLTGRLPEGGDGLTVEGAEALPAVPSLYSDP